MAFVYGEDATADDFGSVGGRIKTKGEDGGDKFWKITDGKNNEKHDEKLERHWRAADDGGIDVTEPFWNN